LISGVLWLSLFTTGCEVQTGLNGNQSPTAVIAGQSDVVSGESVNLDVSTSSDPDGDPLSYSWSQLQGSSVDLQDTTNSSLSFVIPDISQSETFIFQLIVTDGE
jgi:chitinase